MPDLPLDLLPPPSMPVEAIAIWDRLAPTLIKCGILTSADVETFERYCRARALWDVAMREAELSPTRETVLTLAKMDEMVRKLEASFGLTPAHRTHIRVETPAADSKTRFFNA